MRAKAAGETAKVAAARAKAAGETAKVAAAKAKVAVARVVAA